MKGLLKGTTLIIALFFFCNHSFAQDTTTDITAKGKTPVETSTTLQAPVETVKLSRGDGINPRKPQPQKQINFKINLELKLTRKTQKNT